MASKAKDTKDTKDTFNIETMSFKGAPFNFFPKTKPGIRTAVQQMEAMGGDADQIDIMVKTVFASLLADDKKGEAFVNSAVNSASEAAAKAAVKERIASNRAILDKYNEDNSEQIASVAQELEAAAVAMATAKEHLDALRKEVTGQLVVGWELDVQVLYDEGGENARIYIPEDSLGAKPKTGKSGRGGPRQQRIYNYATGPWTATVEPKENLKNGKPNPYHGHTQNWEASFSEDGFEVKLSWDDKSATATATEDEGMSKAGKLCKVKYHEDITGETLDYKEFPLNLMSILDVDYVKVDAD